jgi:hypothetical protein
MNFLRKKIILILSALIIGQAITMQQAHGMMFDNAYIDQEATSDFFVDTLSSLYNNIRNRVNPWYQNTRPFKIIAERAKPLIGAGAGLYTAYSFLPWWIVYPGLATGTVIAASRVPGLSHVISEIGEGLNVNEIANNAMTVGKAVVSPQTVKNAINTSYESGKVAINTIKDDLIDTLKHEVSTINNNIKTEITNNYTSIKDEFIHNKEAIKDEIKNELERTYRTILDIPANQPVNITTVTKKLFDGPTRTIFNIDPEETVTADTIMRSVAKNTIYRFGIPTAALIAGTPIAIMASYFGLKYAYHRLTTEPEPPIFMESSEKSRWQHVKDLVSRHEDSIPDLAYSEELEKTFDLITRSSINAFYEIQEGKKNIFYEPILMYGPPGTGKTAKAKQMIKQIYQATNGKMQWRITNGSMLLKAGQHGINKMFDWLKKQEAACLFIDEADTLFPDREELEKYPERLEIVNHLLSLIGERSNKYMIIMTTNRLGAFDDAMARRIDNLIHIPLPNEQARNRVLTLYRDTMLLNQKSNWLMGLAEKYYPTLFEKDIKNANINA